MKLQPVLEAGAGLAQDLAAFLLPQRCPGCAARVEPGGLLCEACLARIPRLGVPLCVTCLSRGREPGGCLRHPGRSAFAPWIYDERAALVVHALKYAARPSLARPLGEAMAQALPRGYRPDLVHAVPLHPARLRERGYNQAERLAAAVAERLGALRIEGALERVRATRAQARLGPEARRANLAGAFRVTRAAELRGRSVLVVDDVMTTGCTLEACFEPLRACGARSAGLVLAWAQ